MCKIDHNKWSIILNAVMTAISTIIGTLFLGSCVSA